MKEFFDYLRQPVEITCRLSLVMAVIASLIASTFQSSEALGVALALYVISGD